MNKEEIFTKEQIDFVKHCGEHFEVLTGGRGHSKTKEMIQQLQNQVEKLTQENNDLEERVIHQDNLIATIEREKLQLKEEMLQLKDKIKVYENPNDLTDMFMNCNEITKDTINKLNERIGYLERSNNRKEETIIELRKEQELDKYKSVIDKAIEVLKLCNSQCAKETIEILRSKE